MIFLVCRVLFAFFVLDEIHANHVRHHHNLANHNHGHHSHHHQHNHRNHDDYDNDYFDNNVKSDNEKADELNDDDEYYEYMNDLTQQEEIAVSDFHSRTDTDFYDYGANDKQQQTVYEPPDVSIKFFGFMATGCLLACSLCSMELSYFRMHLNVNHNHRCIFFFLLNTNSSLFSRI